MKGKVLAVNFEIAFHLIEIFEFDEFGVVFHVEFLSFDNVVDLLVKEFQAFGGENALDFGVKVFFDDDGRMGHFLLDCERGEHFSEFLFCGSFHVIT